LGEQFDLAVSYDCRMAVGRRRRPDTGETSADTETDAGVDAHDCTVHDGLRKLVQLLPQVTRGIRRRSRVEGVDPGLGPRHGAALSLLREHGPLTVGRLATELGLNLATVSGVVADLERADFVERSPDPADRRRTIVSLVPGRSAVIDTWLDGVTAPLVRALDKLNSSERATFVKAMEYLEAELNALPDEPSL
jgi:DNA-binding MarR family transcriptional regulator